MFESLDAYESSRGINTYVYIYIHTQRIGIYVLLKHASTRLYKRMLWAMDLSYIWVICCHVGEANFLPR